MITILILIKILILIALRSVQRAAIRIGLRLRPLGAQALHQPMQLLHLFHDGWEDSRLARGRWNMKEAVLILATALVLLSRPPRYGSVPTQK